MLNYKMETRMDVRHFSEVVVKADGTTKVQNKKNDARGTKLCTE